jgi:hypothetical protein
MCKFLSAIVLKNGDLILDPMSTNSHELLIKANNLKKGLGTNFNENFARIEFVPPTDLKTIYNIKTWNLKLDEQQEPSWWQDQKDKIKQQLESIVSRHILHDREKDLLVGDWWVLTGTTKIEKVVNSKIFYMMNDSQVHEMHDNSQVHEMYDDSQVHEMHDNSQVNKMWNNSQVNKMYGNSQVHEMYANSQVYIMYDDSQVYIMYGDSQVNIMWNSSQVHEMYGYSQVYIMYDDSQVNEICDNSKIIKDYRKK